MTSLRTRRGDAMGYSPCEHDIDELLNDFIQAGSTTLADMKRVWHSRKFSYIFEARPSTNLASFMQSLYAHANSYMVPTGSLSQRLGALYCMYCLYETQPFKPPVKIYLSLQDIERLRSLVVDAKQNHIKVTPALVKRMMDKNMFLYGSVDANDGSISQRVKEITKLHNRGIEIASEKLFASTRIEERLHVDLCVDLDLQVLKKMSSEYAQAKELAIKEAGTFAGVEEIKHIAESGNLVGEGAVKTSEEWDVQKEFFYQQTGIKLPQEVAETSEMRKELEYLLYD